MSKKIIISFLLAFFASMPVFIALKARYKTKQKIRPIIV